MIKAIHLASFDGNIGDISNHVGFWRLFRKYISEDVDVKCIEIREFYKSWGLSKFDEAFVELVNSYDILIIGGGGFFDVRWDDSETGTTIDIPDRVLKKIGVPIVFNGMGVNYIPDSGFVKAKDKFYRFIHYIDSRPDKYLLSVRNDASRTMLYDYFDGASLRNVIQIPDGAFFTTSPSYEHVEIPDGKITVAINVAKDSLEERWISEKHYIEYCKEFASFACKVLNNDCNTHIVFVPHFFSDLGAITDIINKIPDFYRRKRISIAPCLNGKETPGDYLVDLYRCVDVTIGMRYHSFVCSIAMNTPTIGILTMKDNIELCKNIGLEECFVSVNEGPFCDMLYDKLMCMIRDKDIYTARNASLVDELEKDSVEYYKIISKMLGISG